MSRKIKIIFSIFLFIILILLSNNVDASFTAYGKNNKCYISYDVVGHSDNIKYVPEEANGGKYIKIWRTDLEPECYIDIKIDTIVKSQNTFWGSTQDTYIADSKAEGNGEEDENIAKLKKGNIIEMTYFKVELMSDGAKIQNNEWVTIRIHLNSQYPYKENEKLNGNKDFNIYARGYYENVCFAKFIDSREAIFTNAYKAENMGVEYNVSSDKINQTINKNFSKWDYNKTGSLNWESLDKLAFNSKENIEFFKDKVEHIKIKLNEVEANEDFNLAVFTSNSGEKIFKTVKVKKGEIYDLTYDFYRIKQDDGEYYIYYYNSAVKIKDENQKEVNDTEGKKDQESNDKTQEEGDGKTRKFLTKFIVNEERQGFNNGFDDVLTNTGDFKPEDTVKDEDAKYLGGKISIVLTIITNIGMILAVLMIAILGVKYMLGSVEEKADYKKDMVPYLVGAFLLFGVTTIVKVLQQLGESFNA